MPLLVSASVLVRGFSLENRNEPVNSSCYEWMGMETCAQWKDATIMQPDTFAPPGSPSSQEPQSKGDAPIYQPPTQHSPNVLSPFFSARRQPLVKSPLVKCGGHQKS